MQVRPRDRIPAAHLGSLGEQPRREDERRRLAHVVGVRLEGETEQRDRLSAQPAEVALQFLQDTAFLQLVHLDHGIHEVEVVARVRGKLL